MDATSPRLAPENAGEIAEEVGAEYGRAMAEGLTGDALTRGRRSLRSADRFSDNAISRGLDQVNTPGFRSNALLIRATS